MDIRHRVFFSLSSNIMVLFVPYDYAIFITFSSIIMLMIASRILPSLFTALFFILVYLALFGIGAIMTKKDERWFTALKEYIKHYGNKKNTKLMFKNNYKYLA